MSRRLAALDRVATFFLGALLLSVGAALIAWQQGKLLPNTVFETSAIRTTVASDWYPWASAVGAMIVILLALRWFIAHLRVPKMGQFTLPGSNTSGRFVVLPDSVADAAAQALSRTPGIATAKGKAIIERGAPILVISATGTRELSLAELLSAAEDARANVRAALDSPALPVRVELTGFARERHRVPVK